MEFEARIDPSSERDDHYTPPHVIRGVVQQKQHAGGPHYQKVVSMTIRVISPADPTLKATWELFMAAIIEDQPYWHQTGVQVTATSIGRTTMGNAPASVRWMDNLSRAQTYLALGKRIQLDPAGNPPNI